MRSKCNQRWPTRNRVQHGWTWTMRTDGRLCVAVNYEILQAARRGCRPPNASIVRNAGLGAY